jgi:hypothetical protein
MILSSFRNKISNDECVVSPVDVKIFELNEICKIDVEKSENQETTTNLITRTVPSIVKAIETIKIEKNTAIYRIDEKLASLDGEMLSVLNEFLENQQVVAFHSSIDGKFFVIWKLDELHVLPVLDYINRDDLDELCPFIVEFMVKSLSQKHAGESKW